MSEPVIVDVIVQDGFQTVKLPPGIRLPGFYCEAEIAPSGDVILRPPRNPMTREEFDARWAEINTSVKK